MKIDWRDWETKAFQLAKEQNKPVLLDISACWCHWCHVMDRTTYRDPKVVQAVNQDFVAVKVDNDRRPDINDRYNQGGWPTTVFLTPEGEVIAGGTYIPPGQMIDVLAKIKDLYHNNVDALEGLLAKQKPEREQDRPVGEAKPGLETFSLVVAALKQSFDSAHGGFGTAPKFPMVDALGLALYAWRETGEAQLLELVTKSLTAMGEGGVYDKHGGGFFRYSVTQDWSIPHYEKMLEDNAGLLNLYLDAFMITGETSFREKAYHILNYLLSTLLDGERGVFFGSQDADEEYYQLDRNARANKSAPAVDTVVYTNWNCLMATSLLKAGSVLGEKRYRQLALNCLAFLWDHCYTKQGVCHYYEGGGHLPGLMRDQVALVYSFLEAYQVTADRTYLDRAEEVCAWMLANLWDVDQGGFFDIPCDDDALARLGQRQRNINENALAAEALLRLSLITGKDIYRRHAEPSLGYFAALWHHYGIFAARYAQASHFLIAGPVEIEIKGDRAGAGFGPMLQACLDNYLPRKVIKFSERDGDRVQALVCREKSCQGPFTDPDQLRSELDRK
ncbi:MAG: DUF255 domain-containing protein [Thermodesulfobacteriota bacterium]